MRAYVIRRLLLLVPTLIMVSILVFMVVRFIPGSVIDLMVAEMSMEASLGQQISQEYIKHSLGLDVPVHIQYLRWLGVMPKENGEVKGVVQGDLGNSLWSGRSITAEMGAKIPVCPGDGAGDCAADWHILGDEAGHVGGLCRPDLRHPGDIVAGLLDRDDGDRVSVDMVGLVSVDGVYSVLQGPGGQHLPVRDPGHDHGFDILGGDDEDDAHDDARGPETGLHTYCLVKGAVGTDSNHEARSEECPHSGSHGGWYAAADSNQRCGYHGADICPAWHRAVPG
jgi:hypothetical protein